MWRSLLALVLLAACGGGGGDDDGDDGDDGDDATPATWEDAVDAFAVAVCTDPCAMDLPVNCDSDLRTDMEQARLLLDPTGEGECMTCMDVKVDQIAAIAANGCVITDAHLDAIYATCDLDPTLDTSGDGDPTNDASDACEGFP